MTTSTALARDVVSALLAHGVREVVLAPGSRNAPLAFAVHDAEQAGLLRLHTRIDERTAGFLALGRSKVDGPAAVMCTSGTAVANLLPAVLEAAHSGLGLVIVTADRPARLRGTGASQTTDQVRIFGEAATFLDLAVAGATAEDGAPDTLEDLDKRLADLPWDQRPLHVNVQLDAPLTPADRWTPQVQEVD